jgi:hypothetical protein
MPVALVGFGTLQSVPLPKIGLSLNFPSHLDVTIERKRRDRCRSLVLAQLLVFMGLIPSEVRSYATRYYPYGAAVALLGFFPFKVFSLFASENAFTFSSSYALGKNTSRRKRSILYLRVSKNEEIGWSPKRLPTFRGLSALVGLHHP